MRGSSILNGTHSLHYSIVFSEYTCEETCESSNFKIHSRREAVCGLAAVQAFITYFKL